MNSFFFIIGIIIGVGIGVLCMMFIKDKSLNSYKKGIENLFDNILSNFDKLVFTKRINKYAYFTYETWEIIYQLDNKSIHVFSKEECLATSKQIIGSIVVDKLLKNIDKSWGKDINNTIIIDTNEVSVNFVEEQRKKIKSVDVDPVLDRIEKENNLPYFTIDEILDKINKVGYINLTKEEKDFLNNASK